jgi:hypothetical protein
MKLGEGVKRIIVDARKLTDYALDPQNPVGRHKALVFEQRLGYTQANYGSLLEQIKAIALEGEAHWHSADGHGQRYRVDVEICRSSRTAGHCSHRLVHRARP